MFSKLRTELTLASLALTEAAAVLALLLGGSVQEDLTLRISEFKHTPSPSSTVPSDLCAVKCYYFKAVVIELNLDALAAFIKQDCVVISDLS